MNKARITVIIVASIIVTTSCDKIDSSENNNNTNSSRRSSSPSSNYNVPSRPQEPKIQFSEPPLALPYNGHIVRYHSSEAIAPLEIKTRGGSGNYYVKLVDYYTKQAILTVFVCDGQTVNIDVPLGSIEIKYAVGKIWYGTKHLFGPNTACSKADERFDFRQTGYQVSGFTVELYLQVNGNLETDPIPVSAF